MSGTHLSGSEWHLTSCSSDGRQKTGASQYSTSTCRGSRWWRGGTQHWQCRSTAVDSRPTLTEVVITHYEWTAGANVDRVVVVERHGHRRTCWTTHVAALFQGLLLGQRLGVRWPVAVDMDVGCWEAGLGANDVGEVQDCQVRVDKLTDVRRVIPRGVERHQPQTHIHVSNIMINKHIISVSTSHSLTFLQIERWITQDICANNSAMVSTSWPHSIMTCRTRPFISSAPLTVCSLFSIASITSINSRLLCDAYLIGCTDCLFLGLSHFRFYSMFFVFVFLYFSLICILFC